MRIDLANLPPPPDPKARPKWATYMWERGLTPDDVTHVVGRSREYIRRLGLEWDDPLRQVPGEVEIARIDAWTGGVVALPDWIPPMVEGQARAGLPAAAHP
jgi:hypothetical protein